MLISKSLYVESGSKSNEPGGKYSCFYGKSAVINWPYFIPIGHNSPSIFNVCHFYGALSLYMVRIREFQKCIFTTLSLQYNENVLNGVSVD